MYKEELNIDDMSGEVTYNGSPQFNFAKTFIIPSKGGEKTEIDGFQAQGWDLTNTDSLKYFWLRFIIETKVPHSRFSNQLTGEGTKSPWGSGSESADRDEIRFSYFVNRVRAIFQEILLKPLWLQFVIKHPEFEKDQSLRTAIGLTFNEENLFKMIKERDMADKGASTVSTLMGIMEPTVNPDGTPGEIPYFDPKFLVEKYMEYTETDIKLNIKYKKERAEQVKKLVAAYARINKAKGIGEEEGEFGEGLGGGEFGAGVGRFGGAGSEFGGGEGEFEPEGGGEEGGEEGEIKL